MTKPAAEMTTEEVLGDRRWPAWFTTDQARKQIAHEQAGCPAPWVGAVWNGFNYETR